MLMVASKYQVPTYLRYRTSKKYMARSDEHIKALRLFDLARQEGTQPTEKEMEHLRDCEHCIHILEVFTRQFGKPASKKPGDAA